MDINSFLPQKTISLPPRSRKYKLSLKIKKETQQPITKDTYKTQRGMKLPTKTSQQLLSWPKNLLTGWPSMGKRKNDHSLTSNLKSYASNPSFKDLTFSKYPGNN